MNLLYILENTDVGDISVTWKELTGQRLELSLEEWQALMIGICKHKYSFKLEFRSRSSSRSRSRFRFLSMIRSKSRSRSASESMSISRSRSRPLYYYNNFYVFV